MMLLKPVLAVDDAPVSNEYFPIFEDRNYPFSVTTKSWQLNLILFGGKYPIVLLDNIYSWLYMYINWFAWIIFFMVVYVIWKHRGNKHSPNSLNVMIDYHYQSENSVIDGIMIISVIVPMLTSYLVTVRNYSDNTDWGMPLIYLMAASFFPESEGCWSFFSLILMLI